MTTTPGSGGANLQQRTLPGGSDGEMARLVAAFDWADHPFGTIEQWPRSLRSAMTFLLGAAFPAAMWLGPELRIVYNDAYAPILGPRHPHAFGRPGREIWGELWDVIGPQFGEVMTTARGMSITNQMLPMTRFGYTEETYWNYSFSPLTDDDGNVVGVFNEAHDVTAIERQRQHDRLLIALDSEFIALQSTEAMIDAALRQIGQALGARRTGFGEIDPVRRTLHIRRCWTSDTMPDICGHYPLGAFGSISPDLAAGRVVVIEDNLTDVRTSGAEMVARYEAIELRAGIVVPVFDRGQYAGGVFVQDHTPRRWTEADVTLAKAASARLWQALVRARAEMTSRESEQRYRLIFEQADDIIFTADIEQRITDANAAAAAALGWPREAIIGRSIADFVNTDDFAQTSAMLRHKLEHGGNTRHEVGVIGRDGRAMRWDNNSTLIVDRDGAPVGLLSVSRDVTDRRAFDERRELLIKELNHRVKNTLALVQAIALQTFPAGGAEVTAREEFIGRLRTLAGAHDLLTREQWEGVTLAELVRAGTAALDAGQPRIAAGGPDVSLTPKAAVALAMALHELGTNAVKYGALSVAAGRVDIIWRRDDGIIKIDWRERGGPPVAAPRRSGFGVRMIERVLASDLNGRVRLDFVSHGLHCEITAPVEGNLA